MHHLPDELILHIIAYLEPPELVALQHVSRAFLRLSRDNNLWKSLCFTHSPNERRRQRLETSPSTIEPRLAELIRAADTISASFDVSVHDRSAPSAEVQIQRNKGKRRQVLLANWDPSYPDERVNWYEEFIQRHAECKVGWFGETEEMEDRERGVRREATGVGVLYGDGDDGARAEKLVAPMEDGSIRVWDVRAGSGGLGRLIAKSAVGLLAGKGEELDWQTRMEQSRAVMTETGAVECVSVDSKLQKGFFAVGNVLNEVDLNTLQVTARTPYPFAITALSEAHHRTPLTVGTNWTIHLHDTRKPPSTTSTTSFSTSTSSSSTRCELISGPLPPSSTSSSFSRLIPSTFGSHVSLSQPGALSILHLPSSREPDGNGDIWIGGRFTSLLNFDRRFFPRLRGTVHSGARISCLSAIPHPYIPHSLRLGAPYASPAMLRDVKSTPGHTMLVAGEYKGKGSLELYGLSPEPRRGVNSSDARTLQKCGGGGSSAAYYQNRQTASASKLLAVVGHGTRVVVADADGGLKWVERDGVSVVRSVNINEEKGRETSTTTALLEDGLRSQSHAASNPKPNEDFVQKLLPTLLPSQSPSHQSSLQQNNLILWTGDGRLGMLSFGEDPLEGVQDVWADALEEQSGDGDGVRERERRFGVEMRRALEGHAREVRWLRGYGL